MGEIEMLGGSDFKMDRGKEDGASQRTGGGGQIDMLGGSDMHLSHSPVSSEQKGAGMAGVDMVGLDNLIDRKQHEMPYGATRPTTKGLE